MYVYQLNKSIGDQSKVGEMIEWFNRKRRYIRGLHGVVECYLTVTAKIGDQTNLHFKLVSNHCLTDDALARAAAAIREEQTHRNVPVYSSNLGAIATKISKLNDTSADYEMDGSGECGPLIERGRKAAVRRYLSTHEHTPDSYDLELELRVSSGWLHRNSLIYSCAQE